MLVRFGFTPLFIDADDVERAIAILARIMSRNYGKILNSKKEKVT